MGAFGVRREPGQSDWEFWSEMLAAGGDHFTEKLLKLCRVGNRLWAQVKRYDAKTLEVDVYVMRIQFWWNNNDYWNYTYRYDCDSDGPTDYDCPLSYLDGCTDTKDHGEWWREQVRAYHERRRIVRTHGVKIRFANPLKFTNGDEEIEFTVFNHKNQVRYIGANGGHYRISDAAFREFEVVSQPQKFKPLKQVKELA